MFSIFSWAHWPFCIVSDKGLFRFFPHLVVFLSLACQSSLFNLDVHGSSERWFGNIFSYSVSCLFTFLMVSFNYKIFNSDEIPFIDFSSCHCFFFLKILFIFRERGREEESEGGKHWCDREISVSCLSYMPWPGPEPTTQACALTGIWTSDPSLYKTMPNPLRHTCLSGPVAVFLVSYLRNHCSIQGHEDLILCFLLRVL